jgi:PHP family Zn ribbon phosphoesterase
VETARAAIDAAVGPELYVLGHAPLDAIEKVSPARLAEAIGRMRVGNVIREAGYDGEYGVIRLFTPKELGRTPRVKKPTKPAPEPEKVVSVRKAGRAKRKSDSGQLTLL